MKAGRNLRVLGGGEVIFGDDVTVGDDVTINVTERMKVGARSHIGDGFILEGRDVEIGAEFWSGRGCSIGGGSRFEKKSKLRIGYWCHLGDYSVINTARPVSIGDEVGMGIGTRIFTHGAYLGFLDGFPVDFGPVKIGSHVWLPGATVLPNVSIGDNVVVGVGAVVTRDLPSGCFAAGVPAKVIKEGCYPRALTPEERRRAINDFTEHFERNIKLAPGQVLGEEAEIEYAEAEDLLRFRGAVFDLGHRVVEGEANSATEALRNELRRYGVRFKSYPENGKYWSWEKQ